MKIVEMTVRKVAERVGDAARNAADELLLIDKYGVKEIEQKGDGIPF